MKNLHEAALINHGNMQYFGTVQIGTPPEKFKVNALPLSTAWFVMKLLVVSRICINFESEKESPKLLDLVQVVFDTGSFVFWVPDAACKGSHSNHASWPSVNSHDRMIAHNLQ